jgi:hypothetical protein
MYNMTHCETAVNIILDILGRPTLNFFHSEEELLNLINELKDEPRDDNSYNNQFLNFFKPNDSVITEQQEDVITLFKFKSKQLLFVDQESLLNMVLYMDQFGGLNFKMQDWLRHLSLLPADIDFHQIQHYFV